MNGDAFRQVVPGIKVRADRRPVVDSALQQVLDRLVLDISHDVHLPVEIDHLLEAIVTAAENGELPADLELSRADAAVRMILAPHVRRVFKQRRNT